MSTSIDEKVVRLKLEAGQLTSGIKSALGSLSGLDSALKKIGNTSGIDKLKGAFQNINASPLTQSVAQAGHQFSLLDGIASVTLGGLATKAISAGASMVKSLALDGITDGFHEYEMQLNSVQTILANTKSKGESIKTVNAALDQLNTYADKTIYNFGDMTRNIGTFTAAGVGLKDSVSAIKGLSNLAAASGSSSQQASTAMYQLSQALAAGTVKLMDWNSVVNAGMGGEQFQQALERTARVHGVAVDAMIQKDGSFRDSLQEGWLTSEIMLETLNQMTGDLSSEQLKQMGYTDEQIKEIQEFAASANDAATKYKTFTQVMGAAKEAVGSGWAKTWQLIMGDFEQAQNLWTPVGNAIMDAIDSMSDARNNLLKSFVDAGGRTNILSTLLNLFKAITVPLGAIGKAFTKVFAGPSGKALASFTKMVADLSAKLVMSDKNAGRLTKAFVGIFSAVQAVTTVIGWFLKIIGAVALVVAKVALWVGSKLVTAFLFLAQVLGPVGRAIDAFVKWLDPIGRAIALASAAGKVLGAVFKSLGAIIKGALEPPLRAVKELFDALKDVIGSKLAGPVKAIKDRFSELGDVKIPFIDEMTKNSQKLAKSITTYLTPGLTAFVANAKTFGGSVRSNVSNALEGVIGHAKTVGTIFATVFAGGTVASASAFVVVVQKIATAVKDAWDAIVGFKDDILGLFDKPAKDATSYSSAVGKASTSTTKVAGTVATARSKFEEFRTTLLGVKKNIVDAFNGTSTAGLNWYESALSTLGDTVRKVTTFFTDAKTAVANAFSGGDAIKVFNGTLVGDVQNFARGLASIGDADTSWMTSFKTMGGAVVDFFTRLASAVHIDISGPVATIGAAFDSLRAKVLAFWHSGDFSAKASTLWQGIKSLAADIPSALTVVGDQSKTFGDWISNLFSQMVSAVKAGASKVVPLLSSAKDVISKAISGIFSSDGFAYATQGFTLGGLVAMAMQVKKTIDTLKGDGGGLGGIGDGLKSIGEGIQGFQKGTKPQLIASIAVAIGILAGSLFLLSKVPMTSMIPALTGLLGAIGALSSSMKIVASIDTDGKNLIKLGLLAVGIGVAAVLIASGAAKLGSMDTAALIKGSIAMGIFMGALAGMTKLMPILEQGKSMSVKTGINFVLMAGSLWLISVAISKLGLMDTAALIQGVIATGIVFTALTLYGKFGAANMSFGNAASLLVTAYAMVSIGTALALIGMLPLNAALQGIGIMTVAFVEIGLMMLAMQSTNPLQGAAMMLSVSVLLLSIGASLMMFSQFSWATFWQAAAMMAASLAIIVVAMKAASGGVAGAAAILIISAALLVLAPAIAMLGALPWQVATQGILVLVAALAVLVVAGYAATGAAVGLAAIAATALALSVSVVIAAAGIAAFAAGIVAMGAAIISVVAAFAIIGNMAASMVGNFGPLLAMSGTMAVFGAALLVVGAGALVAGAGFLVLGAALVVMGAGFTAIMATAPAATTVLKSAITAIGGMWKQVLKATVAAAGLVTVGAALAVFGAGALITGAGGLVMAAGLAAAFSSISRFTSAFKTFVSSVSTSGTTNAAIKNIAGSATSMGTNLNGAANSLTKLKNALSGVGSSASSANSAISAFSSGATAKFNAISNAVTGFQNKLTAASAAIRSAMGSMGPAISSQTTMITAAFMAMAVGATRGISAFVAAISAGAGRTTVAMNMIRVAVMMGSTGVSVALMRMRVVGTTAMAGFSSALGTGAGAAAARMSMVSRVIVSGSRLVVNALNSLASATRASIARFVSGIAAGASAAGSAMGRIAGAIRSGTGQAVSAMNSATAQIRNAAVSGINNAAAAAYGPALSIGANISRGIANGIASGRSAAISAASSMAGSALAAAKARLAIHSPSREFFKVGNFTAEGLANGISQNSSKPETAASSMAGKVMSAASAAFDALDTDLQPTITPVLDMSDVEAGAANLSSLFASPMLTPGRSIASAQTIAAGMSQSTTAEAPAKGTVAGSQVVFNQYNTSPKALDRLEIYRQTRNQISKVEGALKAL